MSVLRIVKEGEPILRRKAKPLGRVTKKIRRLISDMFDTMYDADGAGLAAPQIGESLRVIVVDAGAGGVALVDPEIVSSSGEDTEVEGCLSIPGQAGYVTRAAEVVVRGLGEDGKRREVRGEGLLARALQHEIDHLDGILFIDKATGLRRREMEEQD